MEQCHHRGSTLQGRTQKENPNGTPLSKARDTVAFRAVLNLVAESMVLLFPEIIIASVMTLGSRSKSATTIPALARA